VVEDEASARITTVRPQGNALVTIAASQVIIVQIVEQQVICAINGVTLTRFDLIKVERMELKVTDSRTTDPITTFRTTLEQITQGPTYQTDPACRTTRRHLWQARRRDLDPCQDRPVVLTKWKMNTIQNIV